MSKTYVGLLVGLTLGIVADCGGIVACRVVGSGGGLGLTIGLVLDGRLDLGALSSRSTTRR